MIAVKQSPITVVVLTIAFLVTGVAWMLLPSLQSAGRKSSQDAAEQLERARRMVNEYQASLVRKNLLLDRLDAAGVNTEKADLPAIVDRRGEKFKKSFDDRWLRFPPMDWESDPPGPSAAEGNLAALMETGIREAKNMSQQNDRILNDALLLLDDITSHADSTGYVEAHRLKGIIQYYQGAAEALEARSKRTQASVHRRELTALGAEVAGLLALRNLAQASGVDEHREKTQAAIAPAEDQLQQIRSRIAELDGKISKLESKLSAAEKQAQTALKSLDSLRLAGMNFGDPQGGEEYERRLLEVDAAYRAAAREVQFLRHGHYTNALLTPPGEFISGRYVAVNGGKPVIEPGLLALRAQRDALAASQRIWETALGNLQGNVFRQKGLMDALLEREQSAKSRVAELQKQAGAAFDELSRFDAEAISAEDQALELFSKSARSTKAAVDALRQTLNDARSAADTLSPEARERSAAGAGAQDGWISGHLSGQIVDARLARARVYQSRFAARRQNGDLLAAVQSDLALKEADAAREKNLAEEARTAGITEVTEAIAMLETAHREAGRHWTFVAQSGNLADLLVLFGESASAKDALEAYRSAVKGRETQPFVRQLAARIARLEESAK